MTDNLPFPLDLPVEKEPLDMTIDEKTNLPRFLLLTKQQRADAWKGRKLTKPNGDHKQDYTLPRSIDAAGLALFKQQEREREARIKARMAALRALKEKRI